MTITEGDTVTVEYVGRFEDGTIFDTSRRDVAEEAGLADEQPSRSYDPLTVEVGAGELIEGFDAALNGLEVGDSVTVTIPPEEAYGEWDEERIREFERDEIDRLVGNRPVEEGAFLQTSQGTLQEVLHVDDEVVEVDFNHRLAGETLEFDIEVVAVE